MDYVAMAVFALALVMYVRRNKTRSKYELWEYPKFTLPSVQVKIPPSAACSVEPEEITHVYYVEHANGINCIYLSLFLRPDVVSHNYIEIYLGSL